MSGADFAKVREVFHAVRVVDPEGRGALLDRLCAGDHELRREVESLLQHHDRPATPVSAAALGRNVAELLADVTEAGPGRSLPRSFGSYQLLEVLGEGGMGTVYRARQQHPDRVVAVKVIRPGMTTPTLLRRFQQEAQVLGRLQHPGIAQIHEAGSVNEGEGPQPFFAMELVEGRPLDQFAEEHGLGMDERVRLFAKVCHAVQHAHANGVIHRDLKPANILVHEPGSVRAAGRGAGATSSPIAEPKILDFGIARVTDADLRTTHETQAGQLIGTIPYMSPEQVGGRRENLDQRSDVYSLGVILYELLGGRLPHEVEGRTLAEAVRRIQEDDPVKLGELDRRLKGDLETIVGKTLEKEPGRRYASARELAEDLERHLLHQPIRARPASALYQLRKFTRRNRALVVGVAIALVALVGAGIGVTTSLLRARQAATRSASANDWLSSILRRTHPSADGAGIRLLDALDEAAGEVSERFGDDAMQEADVRRLLADMYLGAGRNASAHEQIERALALLARERKPTDEQVLALQAERFVVLEQQDEFRIIEAEGPALLEIMRQQLGPARAETLELRRVLARLPSRQLRFEESEGALREVLDDAVQSLGLQHVTTARTQYTLAQVLKLKGRVLKGRDRDAATAVLEECVKLCRDSLGTQAQAVGERAPQVLNMMRMLASVHVSLAQHPEAEQLVREVLRRSDGYFDEHHPLRREAFLTLTGTLDQQDKVAEAADLATRTIDAYLATGQPHEAAVQGAVSLGLRVLLRAGRFEAAERYARLAIEGFPPDSSHHAKLLIAFRALHLRAMVGQGRLDEARPGVEELRRTGERGAPFTDEDWVLFQVAAARCDVDEQAFERAEESLQAALDVGQESAQVRPFAADAVRQAFEELDETWGLPERARPWRAPIR